MTAESSHALRYLERMARQQLPRRETFERSVVVQTFEPGEVIFESHEEFPYLFAVVKGGVKTRAIINGVERLASIARPGELPRESLLHRPCRAGRFAGQRRRELGLRGCVRVRTDRYVRGGDFPFGRRAI